MADANSKPFGWISIARHLARMAIIFGMLNNLSILKFHRMRAKINNIIYAIISFIAFFILINLIIDLGEAYNAPF